MKILKITKLRNLEILIIKFYLRSRKSFNIKIKLVKSLTQMSGINKEASRLLTHKRAHKHQCKCPVSDILDDFDGPKSEFKSKCKSDGHEMCFT